MVNPSQNAMPTPAKNAIPAPVHLWNNPGYISTFVPTPHFGHSGYQPFLPLTGQEQTENSMLNMIYQQQLQIMQQISRIEGLVLAAPRSLPSMDICSSTNAGMMSSSSQCELHKREQSAETHINTAFSDMNNALYKQTSDLFPDKTVHAAVVPETGNPNPKRRNLLVRLEEGSVPRHSLESSMSNDSDSINTSQQMNYLSPICKYKYKYKCKAGENIDHSATMGNTWGAYGNSSETEG